MYETELQRIEQVLEGEFHRSGIPSVLWACHARLLAERLATRQGEIIVGEMHKRESEKRDPAPAESTE